jgi:hypothetical protein
MSTGSSHHISLLMFRSCVFLVSVVSLLGCLRSTPRSAGIPDPAAPSISPSEIPSGPVSPAQGQSLPGVRTSSHPQTTPPQTALPSGLSPSPLGGTSPAQGPVGSSLHPTPQSPQSRTPEASASAETKDPFKSHTPAPSQAPPGGLFQSSLQDQVCSGEGGIQPGARDISFVVEIGDTALKCFNRFSVTQTSVTITVVSPDGRSRTQAVQTDGGSAAWLVTPLPGDPRGNYSFTAIQSGEPSVTGQFVVIASTTPRVVAMVEGLSLEEGPPGTTFRVGVAGFTGSVSLYLYSLDDLAGWVFQTILPPVQVAHNGEAIVELRSRKDDAALIYGVSSYPLSHCGDHLCLAMFRIAPQTQP